MSEDEKPESLINKKQLVDFSTLSNVVAIGVPALILIGVSYKYGFYSAKTIDATWVISLFSPADLIFASTQTLIIYVCSFLYMTKVFDADESQNLQEFLVQAAILVGLAFGFYIIDGLEIRTFIYIFFSFMGFYLLLYRRSFGKLMGAVIMLAIPYDIGAREARDVDAKSFPIVVIDESKPKDVWYLLDKYGDKAILLKIGKVASQNKFKIMEVKDIKLIGNNLHYPRNASPINQ